MSKAAAHLNFNTRDAFRDVATKQGPFNGSVYDSPDVGRRGTRLVPSN